MNGARIAETCVLCVEHPPNPKSDESRVPAVHLVSKKNRGMPWLGIPRLVFSHRVCVLRAGAPAAEEGGEVGAVVGDGFSDAVNASVGLETGAMRRNSPASPPAS
jgi:hypothetical protein